MLVVGIQIEIGCRLGAQAALPPALERFVQGLCSLADGCGRNFHAQDLLRTATLRVATPRTYISAGASIMARSLRWPLASTEGYAHLGHPEFNGAKAGFKGFGLEAIGVILAVWGTLVRCGLKVFLALGEHGGVEKGLDKCRERIQTSLNQILHRPHPFLQKQVYTTGAG